MAAMRFFLAYQSASTWQRQFPLTEEDFLPRLHEWATMPASISRCRLLPLSIPSCTSGNVQGKACSRKDADSASAVEPACSWPQAPSLNPCIWAPSLGLLRLLRVFPSLCRCARCDPDPAAAAKLLEARRVYATGLLAIGLAASDACAEAVRNGMAVELAKVWRHLIAELVAEQIVVECQSPADEACAASSRPASRIMVPLCADRQMHSRPFYWLRS